MNTDNWTYEEELNVAYKWCVQDKSTRTIAQEVGRTKSSVHRTITRLQLNGEKGNVEAYTAAFEDVTLPLQPILPSKAVCGDVRQDKTHFRSLHYSDVHFPFHDARALDVMYNIVADVGVDIIVDHGDLIDFWQLSSHRPPDEKKLGIEQVGLQEDLAMAGAHFDLLIDIASPMVFHFVEGNHEDRINRSILDLKKDPKIRYLLSASDAEELLSLRSMLKMHERNIVFHEYKGSDNIPVLFDRLVLQHGHIANKWSTRGMLERYGKSVMFGHTHVIQNWTTHNMKGQESSWNIGCMCDIQPHYLHTANWHQGFAITDWYKDGDEWIYDVNQLRVHNGRTVFNGKFYKG